MNSSDPYGKGHFTNRIINHTKMKLTKLGGIQEIALGDKL
jgi:hypothetical protein